MGGELTVMERIGAGELMVNPVTGEMVETENLRTVADALEQLREARDQLNTAISAFTDVIVEHSKQRGTKTIHLGDRDLVISPDYELEWDHERLYNELTDAGLPMARVNELIAINVTYQVSARVAKQIASANPAYAKVIEAAQSRVPKRQYVTVRRER